MTSEFDLIDAIARDLRARRTSGVVAGIGDDAAVLRVAGRNDLVVTVDAMIEGRHFRRDWLTWPQVGARLAAINLSDIAAMGAAPKFALVSLAVPKSVGPGAVRAIERGVARELARFGAAVVGGNLSATSGPLVCDLTLIGTCARGRAWRRRARHGDAIVVAGNLGAAAAGVTLLKAKRRAANRRPLVTAWTKPVPRLDVSALLHRSPSVHGAIDVSDGFSSDVIHLCAASGLGCDIDGIALPIPRAVTAFCARRGLDPLAWSMDGGEDYALILSVAAKRAAAVCRRIRDAGVNASVVGRFTSRRGVYQVTGADGRPHRFRPGGWDHFRS
ncbi:MAG TPA: thiamine-phosphate kinase [Candidatus Krumholzibacteria bacterium]|nr:thiamine-phosphate kinase [Candidatus Krumholzibacteria bacterium]